MAFSRSISVSVTHTKTLLNPDTGSDDKVYGQDYVASNSHTGSGTASVLGAVSGGMPFFDSTITENTTALLAAHAAVMGGGAATAPYTSSIISEGTAAGQGLIVTAGTATTSVNAVNISQTWNALGTTFTGMFFNVTNSASATGSLLADWQFNSVSSVSFGKPGTNNILGSINFPNITVHSGADTLTISSDNNFTSSIVANNSLILCYAAGAGAGIGILGNGTPSSDRTQASPNGMTIGRYGNYVGRHGVANSSTSGNAGFVIQPHQDDAIVAGLLLQSQSSYTQATTNTAGGNVFVAGGIGRRFFTVADFTQLGGKTITVVINGTSTTKTEGVNWTAATSNSATATSIAAAFNGVTGLDGANTVAVGAVAYFQPAATSWTYQLDITTNAPGGGGTVTTGNNGVILLEPTGRLVANLPAAAASNQGARGTVTDSNATLTAGIGAVVAGGGANIVPVFSDGAAWRIG